MFVNISDEKGRIEILQRMLRYLSFAKNEAGILADVSGTFDSRTALAVRNYQASRGLPVTGIADLDTWNVLRDEYERERALRDAVYTCPIPNDADYSTNISERSDIVVILQAILGVLRQKYDFTPVPISGIYTPQTAEAVRIFQFKNGLEPTGKSDRETWQKLYDEYNSFYLD